MPCIFSLVGREMPGQAPGSGEALGGNHPGSIPNGGSIRTLCRARKGVGRSISIDFSDVPRNVADTFTRSQPKSLGEDLWIGSFSGLHPLSLHPHPVNRERELGLDRRETG